MNLRGELRERKTFSNISALHLAQDTEMRHTYTHVQTDTHAYMNT